MRLKVLLVLLVFILFPSLAFSSLTGEIRLSLVEGDVQVRPEGTEEWFPVSINTPVLEGDRIWVPERGRLEIQLSDGSMLRLKEYTSLDVLRVENGSLQYYLNSGSVYVNFSGKKRYLQIDTSSASIRVYEKSKFRVDADEDGRVDVSTYSGNVYVETEDGRSSVRAGSMITIKDHEYAELSPLGPSDEWERWNRERDRRLADNKYSYRYLPDELRPYTYDLDENGRWVYVREYGYVWTPTVKISVGWAPYRHGRWVWIGGDYVWISYEPWGWVPYHYGRWAFVASIGWCWVPPSRGAVYWGPGFVGWVYTPTYVAWVPLAPGEIYYGYGYYGPNSVNIINIDIHKVVVKEYRHAHIRNAITIVHRDTFLRGKPVEVKVHENPFLAHKVHIGRPPLDPVRETRSPIVKEIIRGKEPPRRIRELDVKRLKEYRPLVKERDLSVIKPGKRLKDFPVEKFKRPQMSDEKERQIKPHRVPQDRLPLEKGLTRDEKRGELGIQEPEMRKRLEEKKGAKGWDVTPPLRSLDREGFKEKKDLKDKGSSESKDVKKMLEGRGKRDGRSNKPTDKPWVGKIQRENKGYPSAEDKEKGDGFIPRLKD